MDGRGTHLNSVANRFQPGNPGKPPGAVSLVGRVRKVCEELGFDPIVEAIRRYRDPNTPNASKDYCLGIVADRLLPKLKAVEHIAGKDSRGNVLINVVSGTTASLETVEVIDMIAEPDNQDASVTAADCGELP